MGFGLVRNVILLLLDFNVPLDCTSFCILENQCWSQLSVCWSMVCWCKMHSGILAVYYSVNSRPCNDILEFAKLEFNKLLETAEAYPWFDCVSNAPFAIHSVGNSFYASAFSPFSRAWTDSTQKGNQKWGSSTAVFRVTHSCAALYTVHLINSSHEPAIHHQWYLRIAA